MLDMYSLTKTKTFSAAFSQTLDFVERCQVVPEGCCWGNLSRRWFFQSRSDVNTAVARRYHAGRAMMLCANKLQELADDSVAQ